MVLNEAGAWFVKCPVRRGSILGWRYLKIRQSTHRYKVESRKLAAARDRTTLEESSATARTKGEE